MNYKRIYDRLIQKFIDNPVENSESLYTEEIVN